MRPELQEVAPRPVPLSDILVDEEIEGAALDAVRSGWWSMGARVQEFEDTFARSCDAKAALAVSSGTAALHLALLAVGCGPGDEVVLPSLNFVAAANTIFHAGARPVFCDIRGKRDLNANIEDLEAAITPATSVLLVLHYAGHPCDMDAVLEVAERHKLAVIEDAAHALGARWNGRSCGTFGDVGCFSFFANKNLPTGEGGMVITNDDALAERIRLLRSHGMTTLTWDRERGHAHSYDVVEHGFNYRLDEIRAAIGLVQLRRLAEHNAARARIVAYYREALDGVAGIELPFAPDERAEAAHHLAVIVLPDGCSRGEFQAALRERGVQTSVHYPPIHGFAAYRSNGAGRALPVTDSVAPRIVSLPLYPHMTMADASTVVAAVLDAVA
jgi:dTDP-4-amino-4,6-dideoxygalactose transaminase